MIYRRYGIHSLLLSMIYIFDYVCLRAAHTLPGGNSTECVLGSYENHVQNYTHGAITSDIHICSKIGAKILRLGGNAIDAAISTEFCLYVTDMQATSAGGGGKMVIYIKNENKVYVLNFRERSPISILNISTQANLRRGPLSIATPGNILGLYAAWKTFGTLSWSILIRPSIKLAKDGFKMSEHLHHCTKNVVKYIKKNKALKYESGITFRKVLMKNGVIKKAGSIIRNPALAKTLKTISRHPMSFYNGDVAAKIVKDIQKIGGILTLEDLRTFSVSWELPLRFKVADGLYAYVPRENSGGPPVRFIINMLKAMRYNYSRPLRSFDGLKYYQKLIEIFKFTFAEIERIMESIKSPLSTKYYRRMSSMIPEKRTYDPDFYTVHSNPYIRFEHGTSHLNTFDQFGNAVALTSSINTQLGSYVMSPRTGILFNNHMSDFNGKGNKKFQRPPIAGNDVGPKKEPLSSMCPIIVLDDFNNVRMVSGGSGGPIIVTTIAQILINRFFFRLPYDYSISRWRLHHQLIPNRIQYESHNVPPRKLIRYLEERGHSFLPIYHCRRSSAHSIFVEQNMVSSDPTIVAVGDGRKHGRVSGH